MLLYRFMSIRGAGSAKSGWDRLLEEYPWFAGEGRFPLPAYSEFMPPPRLGRSPYGSADPFSIPDHDPFGWNVSEMEEEYELRPGLEHLAHQIISTLAALCKGASAHSVAGHRGLNLSGNPYWPDQLARAGLLPHERFVLLMPVALSRTQDDKGRVRWTLFGGSAGGPEQAFWKGFFTGPGQELSERASRWLVCSLLHQAYGESPHDPSHLPHMGFGILPSEEYPAGKLPRWTRPFTLSERGAYDHIRHLLTFRPFSRLPQEIRTRYLEGRLNLLPCPQCLVFWGMPTFQQLERELPLAMQIPLLQTVGRHGGLDGLRVPQSGWLHEPHPRLDPATVERELIRDTYSRTHRWNRVHRYEDELEMNPRVDKVSKVLFSTSSDVLGLYDKPMARNCQLWTSDFHLLLDGPVAGREEIRRAEAALIEGGLFGYRFLFPAMRVGPREVYWERPLVAFSTAGGEVRTVSDAPLGYLTASRAEGHDPDPIELWPRLLRREEYLSALRSFDPARDHYRHQTSLNVVAILDARQVTGRPLPRSMARHLLRIPRNESLDDWLGSLPGRAHSPADGKRVQEKLVSLLDSSQPALPSPVTYTRTATRAFEEAWWNDIADLSTGRYLTTDNADCALDPETQSVLRRHHRDLEALGDHCIKRHRKAIAEAGMEGRALCGEVPFPWRTDFNFPIFGGWVANQEGKGYERDILVVIPGRNRGQAVVMADHYDTAYMEDRFERSRGGSGARLAAAGADDNHSATATLLQAAPIFLELAREGRLERDVWLLHLTGEEFPADCLGARSFAQMLVEGRLRLRVDEKSWVDLSSPRVTGLLVMDMIAHNRDDARDVFQISPGKGRESLLLAMHAHAANLAWNAARQQWNSQPERRGKGRGARSADGVSIPGIAEHPTLHGELRTVDDPQSSLYNTDGQIFSDLGIPAVLFMENYDISRTGYHDTHDTLENIDLDYGSAVAAIAIETVAQASTALALSSRA
jgi:Peptidase family M28